MRSRLAGISLVNLHMSDLLAGVDVGSTTVKIVLVDPGTSGIVHHRYVRHFAEQAVTVVRLLNEAHAEFPGARFRTVVCGSGGMDIAKVIGAFFTQEVVANSIVIGRKYPGVRTAIELGGQDAKIIFFGRDSHTGRMVVSDMRMNGVCAGGTGAFIDQVAELLRIPAEQMDNLAAAGRTLYEISGRCGVFAKTDIQPLLNQGVPREDIALSTFHAIAKQTIGGLAQGMTIQGPVLFEGGPMTFNPTLIRVFSERLGLGSEGVMVPEHAEVTVAYGAALSALELYGGQQCAYSPEKLGKLTDHIQNKRSEHHEGDEAFFRSDDERSEFNEKYKLPVFESILDRGVKEAPADQTVRAYLGIDAGSTTSKFVLLGEDGSILDKFYKSNEGDPLRTIREGLLNMRTRYANRGLDLLILGAGSTGYGEKLFAAAFQLDFHTVETIAHTRAAVEGNPDVSFILDIGGQDMKAIYVKNGIPVNFVLNEACSAGCGSFLETYSAALNIPVHEIAESAFGAANPSRLGSRCTVFMNSSVITEQKNGRSVNDIMAGLCNSVVENALTKVLRLATTDALGPHVVVQGGTFRNDAVLRAFEKRIGRSVTRPPHPGEMGAIGIALLTREHMQGKPSRFDWVRIENFQAKKLPSSVCRFCQNRCNRTVLEFGDKDRLVTGNRCEKGEILEDEGHEIVKQRLQVVVKKMKSVPDMVEHREKMLTHEYHHEPMLDRGHITIGIPRSLDFWDSLPFWKTFFLSLGMKVVVSARSDYALFEKGIASVASDTICLPAKIVHGHVRDLMEKKVTRIFHPLVLKMMKENKTGAASWMCPVIQGYSEVVRVHDNPESSGSIYDAPAFRWDTSEARNRQIVRYAEEQFGISRRETLRAVEAADSAMRVFRADLLLHGEKVLADLPAGQFAVVLAGRPYHADSFINHGLASHFIRLGVPVLDMEGLPGLSEIDLSSLMIETNNAFHTRLLAAGILAARRPDLELVQIVSFGCGHDAVLSDELIRVMEKEGGKTPLVLKLDEGENIGPVGIRVRSFIETIRSRRQRSSEERVLVSHSSSGGAHK